MDESKEIPEEPVLPRKALLSVLDDRSEVINIIQVKPYTCVVVRSWYDGEEYEGCGFSKVMYPDTWDEETGSEIAYRRALIGILRQVRKHEMGKRRMEAWKICSMSLKTEPTIDELIDHS